MEETERAQEVSRLYRALVKRLEFEEKLWVLDCRGSFEEYERRLRFLAKKHGVVLPAEKKA